VLSHATRAQIAIIGAGYTGLSAALHLAQAGRDVVVVEAATIGAGASGANGGQVIPGLKHDPDTLESMFGPALGPQLVATVAAGPDLVFELIRAHRIECDAVRTGWIQPAASPDALGLLAARAKQWQRRGAAVEVLTRDEAAQLTGTQRYWGAWLDRRGGNVQPLSYVRGLARAAIGAGARVFSQSPAVTLTPAGHEWRITTPRGCILSEQVIVATNAYTEALHDSLRRSLIAVPSLQVATAPLPPALRATILPQGQAASDTCHLLRYFRMDATGRFLMGTRGRFGEVSRAAPPRHHARAIAEIYPQLSQLPLEYCWGGLVAMTRDHLPHLHELAPGLLAGLGYNGRGVAMATMMGRLLAHRVLGSSAQELGFPVTPVRRIALHRLSGLAVRTAVQLLRVRDALTRLREPLPAKDLHHVKSLP